MNPSLSTRRKRVLLLTAILCAIAPRAFPQGSLTPPAAPTPTMKTLDQVEARIPIAGGTTAVTITADGSYYLTGNITVATGTAITITAKNVTLDLNGYSLTSTASSAIAGSAGISYNNATGSIAIINGHIRSGTTFNSGSGTFAAAGFDYGIYAANAGALCVTDVEVTGVANIGIQSTANLAAVSRCRVNVAAGFGINVGAGGSASTVDHCVAMNCGGDAIRAGIVNDSVASAVSLTGISAGKATGCSGTSGFSTGLVADTATNCTGNSTSGTGLRATTAKGCVGHSVSGIGLSADNAEGSTGTSSSNVGLAALTASSCRGTSAGASWGLQADNTATSCFGQSATNNGLRTPTAIGCFGQSSAGATAAALFAVSATSCRGYQTTGAGEAIHTDIAVSCTSQAGTITATVGRYLMP